MAIKFQLLFVAIFATNVLAHLTPQENKQVTGPSATYLKMINPALSNQFDHDLYGIPGGSGGLNAVSRFNRQTGYHGYGGGSYGHGGGRYHGQGGHGGHSGGGYHGHGGHGRGGHHGHGGHGGGGYHGHGGHGGGGYHGHGGHGGGRYHAHGGHGGGRYHGQGGHGGGGGPSTLDAFGRLWFSG